MCAEAFEQLLKLNRKIVEAVHHLDEAGLVDSTYLRQPVQNYNMRRKNGRQVLSSKIKNAKLHLLVGDRSHVIYAVHVTDGDYSDKLSLRPLIDELRIQDKRFRLIAADAGYNSAENYELVHSAHMTPFIDFASDSVEGEKSRIRDQQFREWKKDSEVWHAGYDRRKVIEAINHAFKMIFTRRLRSKLDHSSRIEALCYVVAFNLTRLVAAYSKHRMRIFWADERARLALRKGEAKRKKAA